MALFALALHQGHILFHFTGQDQPSAILTQCQRVIPTDLMIY
jgi:hypothetical protein